MKRMTRNGAGFLSFVLQAHLPYVLHHGTWPHGLEWLLEAASETYLPLLGMVRRLRADGIALPLNLSVSPVLLEQLASAEFKAELPRYIERKIAAAQEDAAFFEQASELHLLSLARHWEQVFRTSAAELDTAGGDIVAGLRAAEAEGAIDLLTSAATHGYIPLLGTDGSVRGQFRTAVAAHTRHIGRAPAGAWLPECGYRPAGRWQFPVVPTGESTRPEPKMRIGTEAALAESGVRFTFVDSHLVEQAAPHGAESRSLYRPYTIADSDVAVFARDPRTAAQVWSSQLGYPADFQYLDFHKKRWPGGHRYWRVTGADVPMESKDVYFPEAAAERAGVHAAHFLRLVETTLAQAAVPDGAPPILCAPFDLELFGHWWYEGMFFLESVARHLAAGEGGVEAITCANYLERFGTAGSIAMQEGSWGAEGNHSVWLNGETEGLLARMYRAELRLERAAASDRWKRDGRLEKQICREVLLMESSDWPTLVTTGGARDYAERRFREHADAFETLMNAWAAADKAPAAEETPALQPLEAQDGIFADLNPADWR